MLLDRLFELTEEMIKDNLDAETVKIKLDGEINKEALYVCKVKNT